LLIIDQILLCIAPWRWPDRAETCRSTCGYTINKLKVHLLEVIIYILMKMHGRHSIKLQFYYLLPDTRKVKCNCLFTTTHDSKNGLILTCLTLIMASFHLRTWSTFRQKSILETWAWSDVFRHYEIYFVISAPGHFRVHKTPSVRLLVQLSLSLKSLRQLIVYKLTDPNERNSFTCNSGTFYVPKRLLCVELLLVTLVSLQTHVLCTCP
jgi:hypothetical protein